MYEKSEVQKQFPINKSKRKLFFFLEYIFFCILLFAGFYFYTFSELGQRQVIQAQNLMVEKQEELDSINMFYSVALSALIVLFFALVAAYIKMRGKFKFWQKTLLFLFGLTYYLYLDFGGLLLLKFINMNEVFGDYAHFFSIIYPFIHVVFFDFVFYIGVQVGFTAVFFLYFVRILRFGGLSLKTFMDIDKVFGAYAHFIAAIYPLMYLVPMYIALYILLNKKNESSFFDVTDSRFVMGDKSVLLNQIESVKLSKWFALFGVYGVKIVPDFSWSFTISNFDYETAVAFKEFLQKRVAEAKQEKV